MKKLLLMLFALITTGAWAQTDVTSTYLTNAGFDACTAETSDVAAKTIKDYSSNGWTNANKGDFTTIAVTAYGGGKKVGGSTTPSTKKDGTTVSGNTLGIIAGWADNVKIQSGEITLPAGAYTLTVDHYLTSSTNNYTTSNFGFVTSSDSYVVSSTSFTASTWTTETVSFTLTEETTGKIQIGLVGNNKTGSGSPAVFYDDVTITYTDPDAAAHAAALEAAKYSLNGYIKKATALNGVLVNATLATAISTAQGVYDAANDWAEDYDNTVGASSTLNTAITTALSGTTPVALANGNFDTTPNNTLNSDNTTTFGGTLSTATSNPDNTKDMSANTGDHGYLYDVTGWTQYSKFNSTAAQGTTSEYGTAMPANGWSTNSTTPPATDMFGSSTGAALHLSAGWGDQARYIQTISELPSGRYVLYYEIINQYSNTGIASNYIGVNATGGDFYGTTNSFVYSDLKTIEQGVWKAQAFEFNVAKEADVKFSVGVTTSTSGSGNGAKLWIDNVLVYRIGDVTVTETEANAIIAEVEALNEAVYNAEDKSALAAAKATFEGSKTLDNYNALNTALAAAKASVEVYKTLDKAIKNAEAWTATTAAAGLRTKYNNGEYNNSTTAADIYSEYQATEIAALADAEATDYTSAILNPSFETGDMTGWSAESRSDTGVKEQSNSTYSISNDVDGDYIFNSWGGSAENNVYQTIKNLLAGTYQLTALLAGFTGEELILAANDVTNSVIVTGDKTTGNTVKVVFTLNAADDVVIKASNTKATSADASFIKADNFRLVAYSDPLAAYKEQLAALQEEAKTDLANEDYANVTGEEKTTLTTLSTLVPEETEEAYTAAISNITAAISAFIAAKTNYDIFAQYNVDLTYADPQKKPSITSETTAASLITALRAYYESHALAEGVEGAEDFAEAIAGADPDTNTGWTGGIGIDNREDEKYTNAAGEQSGKYYDGGWSTSAGANIDMTREVSVPAGKYLLTVTARGSSSLTEYTLSIGGETVNLPQNGSGVEVGVFGHGWDDVSVEFESDGNPLTLEIKATSTEYQQWVSFNRFRLVQLEQNNDAYAGETEYAALNDAITAAEAKTLGFQNGEYAPYNNVEALQALAAAKAIDQTAELTNLKTDVEAATTALTSATWSDNDSDVDAIYNGHFEVANGWNPKGWTRSNNAWGQQITGLETSTGAETSTAWYYNTEGAWEYGKDGVYTMPLAANQAYKLTFKYRSHAWGSNNWMKASVLNDSDEGLADVTFPQNVNNTNFVTATAYFTTGAAGNYILSLTQSGNTHLTDVSLVKVTSAELALDEATAYEAKDRVYYETIAMTRKVVAGINAVAVPFDLTADQVKAVFGENAVVYTFQDVADGENSTINFNTKDKQTIEANVPVLVGDATASNSQTISGVILKAGEAKVPGTNFDFVGNYAGTVKVAANDYFVSGGKLYKSEGNTNLKSFRAFIQNKANTNGEVKLCIDGVATSIEAIENGQLTIDNEAIYNLAGQRVSKATKGIYVKNGRKVVIK